MDVPASFDSRITSRGAIGAVIIAAHVALAVVLARSSLVRNIENAAPMLVDLFDRPEPPREAPRLADPPLAPVQVVTIPPPEVSVPREPQTTAITATTAVVAAPVARTSGSGSEPPSMSEVAYLRPPAPHYPPESRRAHEEGLVLLRVLIDETGHACKIEISRSSGHPRLDEAARHAVERAIFRPYLEGGIARSALAVIPVEFSLKGARS